MDPACLRLDIRIYKQIQTSKNLLPRPTQPNPTQPSLDQTRQDKTRPADNKSKDANKICLSRLQTVTSTRQPIVFLPPTNEIYWLDVLDSHTQSKRRAMTVVFVSQNLKQVSPQKKSTTTTSGSKNRQAIQYFLYVCLFRTHARTRAYTRRPPTGTK